MMKKLPQWVALRPISESTEVHFVLRCQWIETQFFAAEAADDSGTRFLRY
jgi:hypothetical protein